MSDSCQHFVSVIIPVYNDSTRLKICLEALDNQTYPQDSYEVIVIDNGSDEDIKSVVSQLSQAFYAYESQIGSYAARNKGLSLAKGEIIAFTDSDCIPAPDWLEKGVFNLLCHPNCGLVAGKIELFFKNPDQPTVVELYDSISGSNLCQKKYIEKWRYGATANLFTFRSVIDKVGFFKESLKSSGDKEWGQRVFMAGYEQIYADDTCVAHPARHSWNELSKRIVRLTGGHYDCKKKKGYSAKNFAEDFEDLLKQLLPPVKTSFRVWSDQRLKSHRQKFQYICVVLAVRYLRAWHKILLHLGITKSTRG